MTRSLRSGLPAAAFGFSLVLVYGVAWTALSASGRPETAAAVAGAVTLDLTLLIPALYYLLLARPRGWPMITVLPVFLMSVLVAGWMVPQSRHQVLDLIAFGAVLAEVVLVAVIARRAWQLGQRYRESAATGADVYESLRRSAQEVLGPGAGGVLAYEAAVLYYALAGWRRAPKRDDMSFTCYRDIAYPALMTGLMFAMIVETLGVHLLVRLWSPGVAWVLTGLSLYGLVWLTGDLHAARLRPVRLTREVLEVRVGLRWSLSVPVEAIQQVESPTAGDPPTRRTHLVAVLLGTPNRRLRLHRPVTAVGLYGIRKEVTSLDLHTDDPARFDAALNAQLNPQG